MRVGRRSLSIAVALWLDPATRRSQLVEQLIQRSYNALRRQANERRRITAEDGASGSAIGNPLRGALAHEGEYRDLKRGRDDGDRGVGADNEIRGGRHGSRFQKCHPKRNGTRGLGKLLRRRLLRG